MFLKFRHRRGRSRRADATAVGGLVRAAMVGRLVRAVAVSSLVSAVTVSSLVPAARRVQPRWR
jgi:hypothetical protein